jgi:hypothetical protein
VSYGRTPTSKPVLTAPDPADARIAGLYYVRNPEKLSHLEFETPLTLR